MKHEEANPLRLASRSRDVAAKTARPHISLLSREYHTRYVSFEGAG
jgi:hypothetical protein